MLQTSVEDYPLIAAIDLGSNSFHMVLAKPLGTEIRILDRIGEKVQLGAGINDQLLLDDAAMQRGFDCLRRFAQLITDLPPAAVRVVATSTLRTARNRQVFIDQAQKILGHRIDVISGREEARLIFLGISHSLPSNCSTRLAIDIGGGSTEFIIGQDFESQYRGSLPIGCVRFSSQFMADGCISRASYQQIYTATRLELLDIEQRLHRFCWQEAVGASGTIKSVAQACHAAGIGNGEISLEGIAALKQRLFDWQHVDEIVLDGVKAERASIFPAGLAIVEAIFHALKLDSLRHADGALREGALYDLLGRHHHEDVRQRSILALMERSHVDTEHCLLVEDKCLELLGQLADDWNLHQEWQREMLGWAARTHAVGLDIAHYHYHKHGAYLVEHSDLAGFSRQEQQQLALLVRGHRRNIPLAEFEKHPEVKQDLLYLCVILRLSILLHRIRCQQPPQLQLRAASNSLEVLFPPGWLESNPLTAADFSKEAQWLLRTNFVLSIGESLG